MAAVGSVAAAGGGRGDASDFGAPSPLSFPLSITAQQSSSLRWFDLIILSYCY